MTVQELSVLHRRYIEVSNRFRAAWTFHQYSQGLQKIFPEEIAPNAASARQMADFQSVYNELKQLSQKLNASEADRVRAQLDAIEHQLVHLTRMLVEEDSKISPSLCRQFFQRVKNYDEKILTQLAKFYVFSQDPQSPGWEDDRLDKADYLITKLAEQPEIGSGPIVLRPTNQLKEIFNGLWALFGFQPVSDADVHERRQQLEQLRYELADMHDFEQLTERGLIREYRERKHQLANLFFHPEVLLSVVEINVALKNTVRQLYQREEQRIVAEYQRVFELEREVPVDMQLDQELTQFREVIETFERQIQDKNVRLESLANIRQQVRTLLPRLTGTPVREDDDRGVVSGAFARPVLEAATLTSNDDVLGDHYRRLLSSLESTDRDATPKTVTLQRELYPFRLEPREVVAYRRLTGKGEHNRDLEQFVLESAALRARINEEAAEITGILDDTVITREAPVFQRARRTTRLADRFLRGFSHYIDQLVSDGDVQESQGLQVLRMRLMRDYSGLWLLARKP